MTLRQLADRLQAMGLSLTPSALSAKERGKYPTSYGQRRMIAEACGMTITEFDSLWRSRSSVPTSQGRPGMIPVLNRTSAGEAIPRDEWGIDSGQGFDYVPTYDIEAENAFALVVEGDSMEPELRDGQVVVLRPIRPHEVLEVGDIVVVHYSSDHPNQEGQEFRTWQGIETDEDGGEWLMLGKANHRYPTRRVRREWIDQLNVAIEGRRKFK